MSGIHVFVRRKGLLLCGLMMVLLSACSETSMTVRCGAGGTGGETDEELGIGLCSVTGAGCNSNTYRCRYPNTSCNTTGGRCQGVSSGNCTCSCK